MSEIISEILADSRSFAMMIDDNNEITDEDAIYFLSKISKSDLILLERLYQADYSLNCNQFERVMLLLYHLDSELLPVVMIFIKYNIVKNGWILKITPDDLIKELDDIVIDDTLENILFRSASNKIGKLIIWLDIQRKRDMVEKFCKSGDLNSMVYFYSSSLNIFDGNSVLPQAFVNACIYSHEHIIDWFIKNVPQNLNLIKDGFLFVCTLDDINLVQYFYSYGVIDQDFINWNLKRIDLSKNKSDQIIRFLDTNFIINHKIILDQIGKSYNNQNSSILKYIIEKHGLSSVNEINEIFLQICSSCTVEIARWFYNKFSNLIKISNTLFEYPAESNSIEFFNFLLEIGLDPSSNSYNILCMSSVNNNVIFFDFFIRYCINNKIPVVLNPDGDEYLYLGVCENGAVDIFKYLFYDNVKNEVFNPFNIDVHYEDDYAFVKACTYGHTELAEMLLLFFGVNIHTQDDESFHQACLNGHLSTVQLLVSFLGNNDYFNINDDITEFLNDIDDKIVEIIIQQKERCQKMKARRFDMILQKQII